MSEYAREMGSTVDPEDVTVAELQDELRELDQPVSGTKDELVERLEQAKQEQAANQPDPVAALAQQEGLTEDTDEPHEVRRDGSVAAFSSDKAREQALKQDSYVRETGVDKNGSDQ